MKINYKRIQVYFLGLIILLVSSITYAQKATIREDVKTLKTYAFDEPNALPILKENPKIYPYYKFEGYEHTAKIRHGRW